jgi:DNA polymerase III alpha subunit
MPIEHNNLLTFSEQTIALTRRFCRSVPKNKLYQDRLTQELNIIEQKGFIKCFNQVTDIVELTRAKRIPHILRGSGASSLVSYLLGITDIDPVAEKMILARFMSEYRDDQPDIDLDYPHWIRDQILAELYKKWPNRVARISNDVKYKEKSALREVLKRNGVKGKIPKYFKVSDYFSDPKTQYRIKKEAKQLEGKHRYWSLHCGGVIVYDDEIPQALKMKANQIQLTKYDVEKQNLIKIDVLCNRGLSQLWELDDRPLGEYPYEDKNIAQMLADGDVIGLTQAESRTIRKTFVALKPRNYHDVALCLALIRPAAADGGRKAAYFRDHKKTRMMIYDDDSIAYIAETIGCSLGEADKYRRAFKKGKQRMITKFLQKFKQRNTGEPMIQLNELHKYSYCKGHAIAYGQLVWALAYHKHYTPKKFWAATIKHCRSSYRRWVHKIEAQRVGVSIPNKLSHLSPINQFLDQGWWTGKFVPNCGIRILDCGKVEFRGLIANMRKLWLGRRSVTFVTLGYAPGEYIDLVIGYSQWVGNYKIIHGIGKPKIQHGSLFLEVESMSYTRLDELKEVPQRDNQKKENQ